VSGYVCLAIFNSLQASGVDYEDMLFFDNERWNITGGLLLQCRISGGVLSGDAQQKGEVCAACLRYSWRLVGLLR
jgi:hypothetical protein